MLNGRVNLKSTLVLMPTATIHTSKKTVFNLWLTLLLIWLVANNSLAPEIVLTGVLLAALLAFSLAPFSGAYACIRWSPRVLLNVVLYLGVFLQELVKANIDVLLLVLAPRIHIEPGIVEIKTRLKTPMGRLVLANSITLTPGTLVVDIKDDTLFIHWINVTTRDPTAASRQIAGRFEKYLEIIYG
jgi:multicomponent Na+:H+ antiporter subunit E